MAIIKYSTIFYTFLCFSERLSAYIKPSRQVVDADKSATFNCTIHGSPVHKIVWYRNGRDLGRGTPGIILEGNTLTISRVGRQDTGIYQCLVNNQHDNTQAAAHLILGGIIYELYILDVAI